MKTSRYTEAQIIAILRQAEGGVPVAQLCREHGMSDASFYKWRAKYGGMDASMVSQSEHCPRWSEDNGERDRGREPPPEAHVCRPEHAKRPVKGSPWKKVTGPSQRREMAETAVERRGVSIALACRTFGVSETCYRYSPKLKDENEVIADLLTGLTDARKTWGFGLCARTLAQREGPPMEPQAGLPDLLPAGIEPAE